jgi:hypothetical protein
MNEELVAFLRSVAWVTMCDEDDAAPATPEVLGEDPGHFERRAHALVLLGYVERAPLGGYYLTAKGASWAAEEFGRIAERQLAAERQGRNVHDHARTLASEVRGGGLGARAPA